MSVHGELEVQRDQAAVPAAQGGLDVVHIIDKLASTPTLSLEQVQALTQLVALQERKEQQERRDRFFDALAKVQAEAPRVGKFGLMDRGPGKGQIAYATREDVDAVMRPIYQRHGFSVTWDSPMVDGKLRVVGRFTAFGHTEEREWWCSPDASGGKQGPQAAGSTISYGQRYLSLMFWDVITEGADINGADPRDFQCITKDQARDLQSAFEEVGGDAAKFLKMLDAESFAAVKASKLDFAHQQIENKRKRGKA